MARRLPRSTASKCFIFNADGGQHGGKALPLCVFACTRRFIAAPAFRNEKAPEECRPSGAQPETLLEILGPVQSNRAVARMNRKLLAAAVHLPVNL